MKNKKIFLFAAVLLVVSIFSAIFIPKKPLPEVESATISAPIKTFVVEQKITFANNLPDETITQEAKEGDTVLDLLISTKNPEIKEYSFGKAVESISGIKNGQDKKYWLYSVNGKEASVGAGDYKLAENDKVLWELK